MKIIMLGNDTKEEIEKRIQIVASAGNLSRAPGTVTTVLNTHQDYEKNLKLAKTIVGYGHKSISEHDYLVFALENVTPIVEQIIISYRLTSFTIKSRRNVDFRNVGFYTPTFKDKLGNILKDNIKLQKKYQNYMQTLFEKYGQLIDEQLPVEDCRFILPYSYYSNIIMGCDANEFLRITSDMLYGKISEIDEIKELGTEFKKIIQEKIPYLQTSLEKEENKEYYKDKFTYLDEITKKYNLSKKQKILSKTTLTNYTKNSDLVVLQNIIASRYQINMDDAKKLLIKLQKENQNIDTLLIKSLLKSKNQRELEQVIFSFEIPISLASLTHLTRHRMQSVLIPDFTPLWNLSNYIIPESIKNKHEKEYNNIFKTNTTMVKYFQKHGVRDEDLVYFYLSGNACNIKTTMNARTLQWISRMRCCTKAQWEIRNIFNDIIEEIKPISPLISTLLGPTCTIENFCPEGKDSCKFRSIVIKNKK